MHGPKRFHLYGEEVREFVLGKEFVLRVVERGWKENPRSGLWWQVIVLLNRIQNGE